MALQIFMSYARDDDATPPDSSRAKGFVTFLREQLEFEFKNLGNPRPSLWRDTRRIEAAQQFGPLIAKSLTESELLLVILSRNWMSREWCRTELDFFGAHWNKMTKSDVRDRIILVSKHNISLEQRPALLQGQEGYTFFATEPDDEAGLEREFFERGEVSDKRYFDRVAELAKAIWRQAAKFGEAGADNATSIPEITTEFVAEPVPATSARQRLIYLAKPAADMRQAYSRVAKELEGRGFAVAPPPAADIPHDGSAIEFVDEALVGAEMSIHLLGEKAGYAPDDTAPIVNLQLARAADRAKTSNFPRIIWAPKTLQPEVGSAPDAGERDPLKVLAKFTEHLPADKVEGDALSKFVDFLVQFLDRTAPAVEQPPPIDAETRVYVYHGEQDSEYALALARALQSKNISPIWPVFEGDAVGLKEAHRQNLRDCDTVILCWAATSEQWMRASASELKDWRQLGRSTRFSCRGLIAGPPPGTRKSWYLRVPLDKEIDKVVDMTAVSEPSADLLDPLVQGSQALVK